MSYVVPSERPRTCGMCNFARPSLINYDKCYCILDSTSTRNYANSYERLDNCPLIDIPIPHGRLIDADALKTAFPTSENATNIKVSAVRRAINRMSTIIEAERKVTE